MRKTERRMPIKLQIQNWKTDFNFEAEEKKC